MRVLVIGGTKFLGRRVVERLYERGDDVLVVHRTAASDPRNWVPVHHLHVDRRALDSCRQAVRDFRPDAVLDTCAMSAADVETVLPVLPDVRAVVLSSQDVYQAHAAFLEHREDAPVPLHEDAELRRDRYPYRGRNLPGVPDDYSKRDVEDRWLSRRATVLRLPMVYGPHDDQRREDVVLRRIRASRRQLPVGAANLLWTRGHVEDLSIGVIAALDNEAGDGLAVNLGETETATIRSWMQQIAQAAASPIELVTVPDADLPPDLAITAAPVQHLLVSVSRAQELYRWRPADAALRVAESVRWHLDHPPTDAPWTAEEARRDDDALRTAIR